MNLAFENTACFTGHRPHKLYGYEYNSKGNMKILVKLKAVIKRLIVKRNIKTFITGMALGIDTWSALIVLELKEQFPEIKLVCAIPCAEQWKKWSLDDKEIYEDILRQADYIYYVSEEPYTNWCMVTRDKWMVDNSSITIAVFDGNEDGGTWQTVKYAKKRQRSIIQLHPHTLEVTI